MAVFCYSVVMKTDAQRYYRTKIEKKEDYGDRIVAFVDVGALNVQRIHLVGICGKAMASLAGLLVRAGYDVTGSDNAWNPPMSKVLEGLGISGAPFSPENIAGKDLIVVGNAFSPQNIEAVEARRLSIPQISASEAYAQYFIGQKSSIVVAGTHGKTTTSSLMAHVFLSAEKRANVLIGGILRNTGESYHYDADAAYSIVEGDEYDTAYFDKSPKFLQYRPTIGSITSIEFDHADIYTDMADYLAAFVFFAAEIPASGVLLLNDSIAAEHKDAVVAACSGTVRSYGLREGCYYRAINIQVDTARGGQTFSVAAGGVQQDDFFIPLFGAYNVENALSVIAIAMREGVSEAAIKHALASFEGAEQRQQVLCDHDGIVIMSDFAHHPTAVRVTLQGIRDAYPDRRIIAVFEPRSSTSRRKDFEIPYSHAFDAANLVVIAQPTVRENDNADNMMDIRVVIEGVKSHGGSAIAIEQSEDIFQYLSGVIAEGDVVVFMSNGFFYGLPQILADRVLSR